MSLFSAIVSLHAAGILFTDEPMPERFTQLSGEVISYAYVSVTGPHIFVVSFEQDTAKCELVIIMGTSLYVHPYSTLLDT